MPTGSATVRRIPSESCGAAARSGWSNTLGVESDESAVSGWTIVCRTGVCEAGPGAGDSNPVELQLGQAAPGAGSVERHRLQIAMIQDRCEYSSRMCPESLRGHKRVKSSGPIDVVIPNGKVDIAEPLDY